MSNYYTIVTDRGKNSLIKALANRQSINLNTMGVGDGASPLDASWETLPDERHKFNISAVYPQENDPNTLICEGVITADVGGFTIRQIGVYDDAGVLFAIAQVPDTTKPLLTQGASKDMMIRFYLAVSDASSINIKVDNSVVLATRSWTESLINKKEDKGVAKTLDDALKREIASKYLLKTAIAADSDKLDGKDSTAFALKTDITNKFLPLTGKAADSDKLDGLHGNEYHQRNSANPSKVTAITGNIVDLSQGDNFTVSLSSSGMLTLINPSVGQSGVLIISGATNISGFSSNISFRIVPTNLNSTETFAYFVQSQNVIKMGRV
ncbi:phage tail protein [Campylobacter hyointestinalis]|uniref:phage tail protein n=1 Tax=Campylobacter hyointestinalis TaxID=198 RepID=UPI000DCF1888|nr:phage tail protein [Campylobacter hyointestinalis]RAZ59957.1 hypothetical protein CHL10071_08535 [Campylobacter hyointestinalis subsp. lawsonii]